MIRRPYYGWIVLAVTVPVLMVSAGMRSAAGAWLLPMREDLGWSTATLSLAAAVGLVVYGFAAPLAGALIQRHGVRAVTPLGLLAGSLSMAAVAFVSTPLQLTLVLGVASGLATGIVGGVLGAVVASRWFVRHRGLVVGVTGAAVSAGQLVFYPSLALAAGAFGWREAALGMAAITAVCVLPAWWWLRDGPERLGLAPLGAELETGGSTQPAQEPAGAVMRRAVAHPTFWLLAATFYVCGATSNGLIGQHFIPHAVDHGFTEALAAGALAVVGAFNFVGTILSG